MAYWISFSLTQEMHQKGAYEKTAIMDYSGRDNQPFVNQWIDECRIPIFEEKAIPFSGINYLKNRNGKFVM